MPKNSRTRHVIKKVEAAGSQETLVLSQDPEQPYDTLDATPICAAIAANPRLKKLRVASYVTRHGANNVVHTFSDHPRLEELTLPITKVSDPSQLKIMRLEDDMVDIVATHNAIETRKHRASLTAFKAATKRKRKPEAETSAATTAEATTQILPEAIESLVESFARPRPKRLHLYPRPRT